MFFSQGIFVFLITALLIRILVIVNGKHPTSISVGTWGNVLAPVAQYGKGKVTAGIRDWSATQKVFLYAPFLSLSTSFDFLSFPITMYLMTWPQGGAGPSLDPAHHTRGF